MLGYCAKHNLVSDVEVIPVQLRVELINEAFEHVLKSHVKYRFVIDRASGAKSEK